MIDFILTIDEKFKKKTDFWLGKAQNKRFVLAFLDMIFKNISNSKIDEIASKSPIITIKKILKKYEDREFVKPVNYKFKLKNKYQKLNFREIGFMFMDIYLPIFDEEEVLTKKLSKELDKVIPYGIHMALVDAGAQVEINGVSLNEKQDEIKEFIDDKRFDKENENKF